MSLLAIIGGSGFSARPLVSEAVAGISETPYGAVSAPVRRGTIAGCEVLYLPRHGDAHEHPPHRVNYRANLWALEQEGATRVVALAAVGGIGSDFQPGAFCVPDQLVDYTFGRDHTYSDGVPNPVRHVEFGEPFDADLRRALLQACGRAGLPVRDGGVYGVTQGPRLETAAEIRRMERDGCDMVGMTAMPEAALARELGLAYATLAFVVNRAAGKESGPIQMSEIEAQLAACAQRIPGVLEALASG